MGKEDDDGVSSPISRKKFLFYLDRYGLASLDDPTKRPKTTAGAVITAAITFVSLTLVVLTIRSWVYLQSTIRVGGHAQLNGLYKHRNLVNTTGPLSVQTWPQFFNPSLVLTFNEKVVFFQRSTDRRPIFKVDIIDVNGYHKTFTSDLSETPVGFAVSAEHEVPLNSFDQRVQKSVANDRPNVMLNLQATRLYSQIVSSLESLQIIRNLQADSLLQTRAFQNHSVLLLVRFNENQIKSLKKCQFYIDLYNEGEFQSLANNDLVTSAKYRSKDFFNGQASSSLTWTPASFGSDGAFKHDINFISVQKDFTKPLLDQFLNNRITPGVPLMISDKTNFMDWSYVINYVNNFNYTFQQAACDDSTGFNTSYIRNVPFDHLNDTTLVLPGVFSWPDAPFDVLVECFAITERIRVTSVLGVVGSNQQVLMIERDVNATILDRLPTNLSSLVLTSLNLSSNTWVCPLEWYGDGVCNCECGSVDVDCLANLRSGANIAQTGCDAKYSYGPYCSLLGRCWIDFSTSLTVSSGCRSGLHLPAETVLVGYQGDLLEYSSSSSSSSLS
uniref:Uncharacterized protein n=1 Tax=Hanusia phi TaxID=3032 RepID=A0A7S0EMT9_9CRYP|mmetsp:Transcript_2678/g.6413  ORF Transcript_2678/g.6413 Transcript_2678/m.6413 type:complete len:556 (+) Transcript_2678:123-1790(+)